MRLKRIISLNYFALFGVLVLLPVAILLALLEFDQEVAYFNLLCAFWIIVPIGLIYSIVVIRVLALDIEFIRNNPSISRYYIVAGIISPLILTILSYVSTPVIYFKLEQWAFLQSIRQVTPFKSEISIICNRLLHDPDYITHIPQSNGGSYYQVSSNDHVIIWPDESGDAYWFDVADSLSSGGYVCIRPGVSVEVAITNYEFWTTKRELIKVFDNFYWWN